jgi:predicted ATPase
MDRAFLAHILTARLVSTDQKAPFNRANAVIPRIREVHIRNYKSISQAVVQLSDLTLLVGPNGSGKSNFVDALAFAQECLSESVESALRSRGGFGAVRHRSAACSGPLGLRFVLDLGPEIIADYAFEIAGEDDGSFRIARERCVVSHRDDPVYEFAVADGRFEQEIPGIRPAVEPDRLALYAASATEEFREVYHFLTRISTYAIDPLEVGQLQDPSPGLVLSPDGSNAASVLKRLAEVAPDSFARVSDLLARVVPGITKIRSVRFGRRFTTIAFVEDGTAPGESMEFHALSMSEGTLRLLGLLLAVYQTATPSVLIVEEPEVAIHPAAAEIVMSVLLDAAKRTQVLVTTHSPDILDDKAIHDEMIRIITKSRGQTIISPVSESSRMAIRERLYSPGELLRSNELNADESSPPRVANLFGTLGEAA